MVTEVSSQHCPKPDWIGGQHLSEGTVVVIAAEVPNRLFPSLKLCAGGVVYLGNDPKERILRWAIIWGDHDRMP